jgi:hypothetical protein
MRFRDETGPGRYGKSPASDSDISPIVPVIMISVVVLCVIGLFFGTSKPADVKGTSTNVEQATAPATQSGGPAVILSGQESLTVDHASSGATSAPSASRGQLDASQTRLPIVPISTDVLPDTSNESAGARANPRAANRVAPGAVQPVPSRDQMPVEVDVIRRKLHRTPPSAR